MPGASPAAFALALPGNHYYCWDAGESRPGMYGPRVDSLNQIRHIGPATENRSLNLMELYTTGLEDFSTREETFEALSKQTCKNQFMTSKQTTSPL